MIETGGERESGKSMLTVQLDDDDDDDIHFICSNLYNKQRAIVTSKDEVVFFYFTFIFPGGFKEVQVKEWRQEKNQQALPLFGFGRHNVSFFYLF